MIVGITFSAFDFFHCGHVAMLKECSNNCDYLIAGLHVDPSLERSEKNKPFQTLYERYVQLKGCKYINEIIPYQTEQDLINILLTEKIDKRFVGEEYRNILITGQEVCEKNNIEIVYNSRKHTFSSSNIRKHINA